MSFPRAVADPLPAWISNPQILEDYFSASIVQAVFRLNANTRHNRWKQCGLPTYNRVEIILAEAGHSPWKRNVVQHFDKAFLQMFAPKARSSNLLTNQLDELDVHVAMLHEDSVRHYWRLYDFTLRMLSYVLDKCNKDALRKDDLRRKVRHKKNEPARDKKEGVVNFVIQLGRNLIRFYENWVLIKSGEADWRTRE